MKVITLHRQVIHLYLLILLIISVNILGQFIYNQIFQSCQTGLSIFLSSLKEHKTKNKLATLGCKNSLVNSFSDLYQLEGFFGGGHLLVFYTCFSPSGNYFIFFTQHRNISLHLISIKSERRKDRWNGLLCDRPCPSLIRAMAWSPDLLGAPSLAWLSLRSQLAQRRGPKQALPSSGHRDDSC